MNTSAVAAWSCISRKLTEWKFDLAAKIRRRMGDGDDKHRRRKKLIGDFAYLSHKIRSHKGEKTNFTAIRGNLTVRSAHLATLSRACACSSGP